jgi:hypothetical protein
MKTGTTYNGYKNWTRWNVSLWLNNEEGPYYEALSLVKKYGRVRASWKLFDIYQGTRTPDGAKYSRVALYDALEGMGE